MLVSKFSKKQLELMGRLWKARVGEGLKSKEMGNESIPKYDPIKH